MCIRDRVLNENNTDEILTDICWALSYVSDGGNERVSAIINSGVVPRLVQLLEHQHIAIAVACLRTIGNTLTGSDEETQMALNAGVLDALVKLINHPKKAIRKEVCWSVSNITAGNAQQISQVLDCGLIDKLINVL